MTTHLPVVGNGSHLGPLPFVLEPLTPRELSPLVLAPSTDFEIPLPPGMEIKDALPIDIAIDRVAQQLGLPLLGGPSAAGWSYYKTALQCAYLWQASYRRESGVEYRIPAEALQVGGLYHALQALYYGYGLGEKGVVWYKDRGLARPEYAPGARGKRKGPGKDLITVPVDAADRLIEGLKALALKGPSDGKCPTCAHGEHSGAPCGDVVTVKGATATCGCTLPTRPAMRVIFEAERLFDAYTEFYGRGGEDVTPLAIEWSAMHGPTGYTCRYDAIVRAGPNDPLFPKDSVFVLERKTSAWMSLKATDGWWLDGQVLGQLMTWKSSGCERMFGPLAGIVIDIVTKEKTVKPRRIRIAPDLPTVKAHERIIRWMQAQIKTWEAAKYHPQNWASCWNQTESEKGQCGLWNECAGIAARVEDVTP
ncbi:MAG: hypothetical protein Q8S13_03600 [Dehalococcoidia bacterium]|nr:hypothetical protein [Dehalococcoidia bacterium]